MEFGAVRDGARPVGAGAKKQEVAVDVDNDVIGHVDQLPSGGVVAAYIEWAHPQAGTVEVNGVDEHHALPARCVVNANSGEDVTAVNFADLLGVLKVLAAREDASCGRV